MIEETLNKSLRMKIARTHSIDRKQVYSLKDEQGHIRIDRDDVIKTAEEFYRNCMAVMIGKPKTRPWKL